MDLARLQGHPQALSMETLQRVRDTLEQSRELSKELGDCLDLTLERFHQEPPCVQGNARLRIFCNRKRLEFLSGKGEYRCFVFYSGGNPVFEFCVQEILGSLYVARLRSRKDPLSAINLLRFHTDLGFCQGDNTALRACLGRAWVEFSQEPRYVQKNARLLVRWGREELELISGKGECEITVCYRDGISQYGAVKIPLHVYLDQLRARLEPLSPGTLWRVFRELGSCHGHTDAVRACLLCAWKGLSKEPQCVQANARLQIQLGEGHLEFVSGQGQCEILVLHAYGQPQYHITALGGHSTVTWSCARPEPLSLANLARVRTRLGRWGVQSKELSGCFEEAISQFRQEPPFVQQNSRIWIYWDMGCLEFLSGKGWFRFSVWYHRGNPRYYLHVEEIPGYLYVSRVQSRQDPLSADSLHTLYTELGSCCGDNTALRACVARAWEKFCQEPQYIQENARLPILLEGLELQLVSGRGEYLITV